jgi:hypothetical protein
MNPTQPIDRAIVRLGSMVLAAALSLSPSEWLNVSSGFDIPEFFAHAREELLRGGYAWVGVSAQALGVQLSPFALKAWDPLRYGTLLHPGDASFTRAY